MNIFYDNIETVKDFLGNDLYKFDDNQSNSIGTDFICNAIFERNRISFLNSESTSFWKHIFITKHSKQSQFDIVCNLVSENYNLPENFLCLAESGDEFHGFRNRAWDTRKGNIHLTLFFRPSQNLANIHTGLIIVAAVSVLRTIDSIPSLENKAQTKWVNDIILNNSKVCGIITKSFSTGNSVSGSVIGLGLNVLTTPKIKGDSFTSSATSVLDNMDDNNISIQFIFANLLKNLASSINLLNSGGYDKLLEFYITRSFVIGKNVVVYSDDVDTKSEKIAEGKVININNNLELILANVKNPIRKGRLSIID